MPQGSIDCIDSTDSTATDQLLANWLQSAGGGRNPPPDNDLAARIDHHGIAGLLSATLPLQDEIPANLVEFVRERAIALAYWEARHARHLIQVLDLLREAGANPLVFKGTALAYSAYDAPFMRVRGDSDVIVSPNDFAAACAALEAAGYTLPYSVRGTRVSATRVYRAPDPVGDTHDIDLHQRISNSAALAQLFPFEELQERSQPLPTLSDTACAVGPLDALMIACFHRKVHAESPYFINGTDQHDPNRMIWLADIDLLARSLPDAAWAELSHLCEAKGLGQVVADGIRAAKNIFATPVLPSGLKMLTDQPSNTAPARYLATGPGRRTVLNLQATPGLMEKGRFLAELFLPHADYLRAVYPEARLRWLPWLYLRYIGSRTLSRALSRSASSP